MIAFVGIAPAFFINTASFAAVMIALRLMKPALLSPAKPVARGGGQLRAGLHYVRGEPRILLLLVIVFFFGTFCMNFQITNALMAVQVFHKGAGEYGLLGSIMAIGSLSAALLSARRKIPSLRVLIIALLGFAVSSTIAGLAPNYLVFAIALIPLGLSALTVMTTANASVQLAADPQMRGRVMALYMAVFMGGTPIGSPIIGLVGQEFGARWTILIGSIVALLVAVSATLTLMRRRNVSVSDLSDFVHMPTPTH